MEMYFDFDNIIKNHINSWNKEFKINDNTKLTVEYTNYLEDDYIIKISYYINNRPIHFGTLRDYCNIIMAELFTDYFYDIWSNTSICIQKNGKHINDLIIELVNIDPNDVINDPIFEKNQWIANKPIIFGQELAQYITNGCLGTENKTYLSPYQKRYKKWLDIGLERNFISNDMSTDLINDYCSRLKF